MFARQSIILLDRIHTNAILLFAITCCACFILAMRMLTLIAIAGHLELFLHLNEPVLLRFWFNEYYINSLCTRESVLMSAVVYYRNNPFGV